MFAAQNMVLAGANDRLSLDLQFATDKTLTARKGPTPTYTRASTATFVGSDGLIQSAAINEARFDHDPVTLACKGLLIEESRTNLVFPSATLATQTRTVTAVAHTLSFYGTGTVVLSGTHVATVTGTGAYPTRTTLTFTPTAGSLIMTVTGSVTEGQLEAGAFPTSYIPTTTASVVRSGDLCSITGSDFTGMYNEFAGTVLCESTLNGFSLSANPNTASFGGGQNGITMREYTGAPSLLGIITADENTTFDSNIGNIPSGVARKSSMAFQNDGSAILCLNGVLGTQDTSITLPIDSVGGITPTGLFLFMGQFSTVKSFRYFKKRLANAKLQALTQFVSDTDANAYIVSLLAAGATLDTPQQNAINTFVSGEKTAGRWDGIKRFYFPVWGVAAANAVCMKSLTTGTWTGGTVNHAAGYVQSSIDGGYMNTNTTFPALGITKDSYHFAVVYKTSPTGGDNYSDISFGTANVFSGFTEGLHTIVLGGEYFNPIENLYQLLSIGGNASSRYVKDRSASGVITVETNNQVINDNFDSRDIWFLRANTSGVTYPSSAQTGLLSLGTTLTTEQDTAYTLALKTLWETCTGLTLP